eukprot:m.82638 g.82638  ORF g.82638 m.82638 type:complete len:1708 (-) comp13415_c0_seq1:24-5147(-)
MESAGQHIADVTNTLGMEEERPDKSVSQGADRKKLSLKRKKGAEAASGAGISSLEFKCLTASEKEAKERESTLSKLRQLRPQSETLSKNTKQQSRSLASPSRASAPVQGSENESKLLLSQGADKAALLHSPRRTQSSPAKASTPILSSSGIACPVCGLLLGAMSATKQEQHVNACLDRGEAAEGEEPAPAPAPASSGAVFILSETESASLTPRVTIRSESPLGPVATIEGEDNTDLFFCTLCQRELTHFAAALRMQHVNRCCDALQDRLDSLDNGSDPAPVPAAAAAPVPAAAAATSASTAAPPCPLCHRQLHVQAQSRGHITHLKRCAAAVGMTTANLIALLRAPPSPRKRQATLDAFVKRPVGLPAMSAEADERNSEEDDEFARDKRGAPPVRGSKRRREAVDPDMRMAMALSRSLVPSKPSTKRLTKEERLASTLPELLLGTASQLTRRVAEIVHRAISAVQERHVTWPGSPIVTLRFHYRIEDWFSGRLITELRLATIPPLESGGRGSDNGTIAPSMHVLAEDQGQRGSTVMERRAGAASWWELTSASHLCNDRRYLTGVFPAAMCALPDETSIVLAARGGVAGDLAALLDRLEWCDTVLACADGAVPVHALVLRARCPGLTLLNRCSIFGPHRFTLTAAPAQAVALLLRCLYVGPQSLPPRDAAAVVAVADALGCSELFSLSPAMLAAVADHAPITVSSCEHCLPAHTRSDSMAESASILEENAAHLDPLLLDELHMPAVPHQAHGTTSTLHGALTPAPQHNARALSRSTPGTHPPHVSAGSSPLPIVLPSPAAASTPAVRPQQFAQCRPAPFLSPTSPATTRATDAPPTLVTAAPPRDTAPTIPQGHAPRGPPAFLSEAPSLAARTRSTLTVSTVSTVPAHDVAVDRGHEQSPYWHGPGHGAVLRKGETGKTHMHDPPSFRREALSTAVAGVSVPEASHHHTHSAPVEPASQESLPRRSGDPSPARSLPATRSASKHTLPDPPRQHPQASIDTARGPATNTIDDLGRAAVKAAVSDGTRGATSDDGHQDGESVHAGGGFIVVDDSANAGGTKDHVSMAAGDAQADSLDTESEGMLSQLLKVCDEAEQTHAALVHSETNIDGDGQQDSSFLPFAAAPAAAPPLPLHELTPPRQGTVLEVRSRTAVPSPSAHTPPRLLVPPTRAYPSPSRLPSVLLLSSPARDLSQPAADAVKHAGSQHTPPKQSNALKRVTATKTSPTTKAHTVASPPTISSASSLNSDDLPAVLTALPRSGGMLPLSGRAPALPREPNQSKDERAGTMVEAAARPPNVKRARTFDDDDDDESLPPPASRTPTPVSRSSSVVPPAASGARTKAPARSHSPESPLPVFLTTTATVVAQRTPLRSPAPSRAVPTRALLSVQASPHSPCHPGQRGSADHLSTLSSSPLPQVLVPAIPPPPSITLPASATFGSSLLSPPRAIPVPAAAPVARASGGTSDDSMDEIFARVDTDVLGADDAAAVLHYSPPPRDHTPPVPASPLTRQRQRSRSASPDLPTVLLPARIAGSVPSLGSAPPTTAVVNGIPPIAAAAMVATIAARAGGKRPRKGTKSAAGDSEAGSVRTEPGPGAASLAGASQPAPSQPDSVAALELRVDGPEIDPAVLEACRAELESQTNDQLQAAMKRCGLRTSGVSRKRMIDLMARINAVRASQRRESRRGRGRGGSVGGGSGRAGSRASQSRPPSAPE